MRSGVAESHGGRVRAHARSGVSADCRYIVLNVWPASYIVILLAIGTPLY